MSLTALVFPKTRVTIGVVELDASISEDHQSRVSVTRNPVEKGLDVTDHIRAEPQRLTIRGVISNAPIGRPGLLADPEPNRAENAHATLLDLQARGELLTVATTLRDYTSMALENVDVNRTSESGDSLDLTLTLVEIRIVESDTVAIDPSTLIVKRTGGKSSRGKKTKKKKPSADKKDPKDNRTTAARWYDEAEAAGII